MKLATEDNVSLLELLDFVRPRHKWIMTTVRSDGRPQISPVTGGVNAAGQLVVSTYPERDKVHNLRRNDAVTLCVMSDEFGGSWVQVDGRATIVDMPEALEALVDYYQSISGEHPNWDEYREAMHRQGKCVIAIDIERWGPVAKGGFPPRLANLDQFKK